MRKILKNLITKTISLLPRELKEKLKRNIYIYNIYEEKKELNIVYKLNSVMNFRLRPNYIAYLNSYHEKIPLRTMHSKKEIRVVLPIDYIVKYLPNFQIELYSNETKMNITPIETDAEILTNLIINENFIQLTFLNDIIFTKKLENFILTNESIEVSSIRTENSSLIIQIKNFNLKIGSIFALYKNKYLEIFDIEIIKNFIVIKNLNQFSRGILKFYVEINQKLYLLSSKDLKTINIQTDFYNFNLLSEKNHVEMEVTEHTLEVEELVLRQETANVVSLQFTTPNKLKSSSPKVQIIDQTSSLSHEIDLSGNYSCSLPLEELVSNFSSKSIKIKDDEKLYQLNLRDARISNKIPFKYNYKGEILKIKFSKKNDHTLEFEVKRPTISRVVTHIEGLALVGKIVGNKNFTTLKRALILIERDSQKKIIIPIDKKFEVLLNTEEIKQIITKDKTIIDIFVGFLNGDEVIRQVKIKYQKSHYKKDNYYSHQKITEENGDEIHFLFTTTPFDNLKMETFRVPSSLVRKKYSRDKNVWLIGERTDTAQESGVALFKYLLKNSQKEVYYVINKDSKDYQLIKHLPNILIFGSIDHYIISLKAGTLLCTHDFENILPYKAGPGFFNYENTFKVFLQHGVLGRKPAEYHKKYYEIPFDMFIVSSEAEKYNVVIDEMGYAEEEVYVTGLARFDNLPFDKKGKDILLMPTWRDWINTEEAFLESEYYRRYKSLVENERLQFILEKYNIYLNFYPHYRAQIFFNSQSLNIGKNIRFIELGERTVQDLLINHALLITDYSSVSFDFTLMRKPVIYYHFDEIQFFARGILRPINETFLGDIAETEEQIIGYIEKAMTQNFEIYPKDLSRLFSYIDHDNSERIYKAIIQKNN